MKWNLMMGLDSPSGATENPTEMTTTGKGDLDA